MSKRKLILPITTFCVMVMIITHFTGVIAHKSTIENAVVVEKNIRKAAIACYAIEGSYPQEIDYLEKNYGLLLDHSQYVISYESIGSNIMPAIAVVPVGTYHFDNEWSVR